MVENQQLKKTIYYGWKSIDSSVVDYLNQKQKFLYG